MGVFFWQETLETSFCRMQSLMFIIYTAFQEIIWLHKEQLVSLASRRGIMGCEVKSSFYNAVLDIWLKLCCAHVPTRGWRAFGATHGAMDSIAHNEL